MTDSEQVLLRFEDPRTGGAVVLEDDGRVAYAYLIDRGEIVSDVWLYNVAPAPEEPEWRDRSKLPFLNPSALSLPFLRSESTRWHFL